MHYKTIFISDTHLGLKASKANLLNDFLKSNSCDTLYLVGDIVDFEILKKRWYFPKKHFKVLKTIIDKAKDNTDIFWLLGNHDEDIRKLTYKNSSFSNITFIPYETTFKRSTGEEYLLIHGDMFDAITRTEPRWGRCTYLLVTTFVSLMRFLRLPYFSLPTYLRQRGKKLCNQTEIFKKHISRYVKHKGLFGVICGHTHTPEIEDIHGITYMNDGDWVHNSTALVEHHDGEMEIISWK